MSEVIDDPLGWDSDFQRDQVAILEQDDGENFCETIPDGDLEIALSSAVQHMENMSLRFVCDGMSGEFRFRDALATVRDHVKEAHCLSSDCMKLVLTTIGTILDRSRETVKHERAPFSAMQGLNASIEGLGSVVIAVNKMNSTLAKQIELDRKRALHRRRRRH